MRTLLTVANRRPVDLISPLLVQEEQITSAGSTGHKSTELAPFSVPSAHFPRRPHFLRVIRIFGLSPSVPRRVCVGARPRRAAPRPQTQRGRGPRKMQIICPPLPRTFVHVPQYEWCLEAHVRGQDEEARQRIVSMEELLHWLSCKIEVREEELR